MRRPTLGNRSSGERRIESLPQKAQQCCIDLLLRYCRLFFAAPERRVQGEGEDEGEAAPGELPEDLATFLKSLRLLLSSSSKGVTLAAAAALCYLAGPDDLKACVRIGVGKGAPTKLERPGVVCFPTRGADCRGHCAGDVNFRPSH